MNKVGILGFGNMGSVIAEKIKTSYKILIFDKDINKTAQGLGFEVVGSVIDLVKSSEAIILAVKPQDFDTILNEIKAEIGNKLVISIAAGVSTDYIARTINKTRIIRVMPNLLSKIGEGTTFLCRSVLVSEDDINFCMQLFEHLGETWLIEEEMMNAATVASGSGPGILCYELEKRNIDYRKLSEKQNNQLVDEFESAAASIGFNIEDSKEIAMDIINGTIDLLKKEKILPSELKNKVTSKGGTTEAAIEVLSSGGDLKDAFKAAVKRAKDLSRS